MSDPNTERADWDVTDIPELLAEIDSLRAEVKRLTPNVIKATVHLADGSVAELPPSMFWTMNGIVDEFGKDITS